MMEETPVDAPGARPRASQRRSSAEQRCVPRIEGEVPGLPARHLLPERPRPLRARRRRYRHWLDGDGMVCALRFGAEGVRFTSRYVRGTRLAEEEAAGRPLYRSFGTAFPGDRLVRGVALESPLNVSIYPWGESLLAFGEQGLPWELDPETLETRGPSISAARVNPVSPFAAHPKIDPRDRGAVQLRHQFRLRPAEPQPLPLRRRREPRLPPPSAARGPGSLHDFCLSGRHVIFHLGPYL